MKKMNSPASRFLLLLLIPALICTVFLAPAPAGADGATPGIINTVAGINGAVKWLHRRRGAGRQRHALETGRRGGGHPWQPVHCRLG